MKVFALLLCLAVGCSATPTVQQMLKGVDKGNIWALIVAGSNTWDNYRHQADACHAYQIFHAHGVPDEHIVVMMYDDIAENEENPTKGKIINHPAEIMSPDSLSAWESGYASLLKGPNVYTGVPHDYTKREVTPENFLNILQGKDMNGTGSGKTIKSGPDDYVFVNFVDHGAPGIVAFPTSELSARKLNTAIKSMHSNNQYKQMVVYVEACESGSMFDKLLPDNINVYATTAANPTESSYACYYDAKLETYLGDVYSVKWMENVDKVGTATETLEKQYKVVKNETTTSHVMQYGDLSLDSELLEVFMGSKNNEASAPESSPITDAVPSGDVRIAILSRKIFNTPNEWDKRDPELKLMEELLLRQRIRYTVEEIVKASVPDEGMVSSILGKPAYPQNYDCLEAVVGKFSDVCFQLGQVDYALRHTYALVNLCEAGILPATILQAIDQAC